MLVRGAESASGERSSGRGHPAKIRQMFSSVVRKRSRSACSSVRLRTIVSTSRSTARVLGLGLLSVWPPCSSWPHRRSSGNNPPLHNLRRRHGGLRELAGAGRLGSSAGPGTAATTLLRLVRRLSRFLKRRRLPLLILLLPLPEPGLVLFGRALTPLKHDYGTNRLMRSGPQLLLDSFAGGGTLSQEHNPRPLQRGLLMRVIPQTLFSRATTRLRGRARITSRPGRPSPPLAALRSLSESPDSLASARLARKPSFGGNDDGSTRTVNLFLRSPLVC